MNTLYKKTLWHYIFTLILFFAVVTGTLFFFRFVQKSFAEVRSLQQTIASYKEYRGLYDKEIEKIQTIEAGLEKLEREIVTDTTLPLFLSTLEQQASASGLVIEIASAQVVAPRNTPKSVKIDITAEGTYQQIFSFIERVNQGYSEVVFENLRFSQQVSSDDGGDLRDRWEFSTSLSILSYK